MYKLWGPWFFRKSSRRCFLKRVVSGIVNINIILEFFLHNLCFHVKSPKWAQLIEGYYIKSNQMVFFANLFLLHDVSIGLKLIQFKISKWTGLLQIISSCDTSFCNVWVMFLFWIISSVSFFLTFTSHGMFFSLSVMHSSLETGAQLFILGFIIQQPYLF